jgi:hypothetical protein
MSAARSRTDAATEPGPSSIQCTQPVVQDSSAEARFRSTQFRNITVFDVEDLRKVPTGISVFELNPPCAVLEDELGHRTCCVLSILTHGLHHRRLPADKRVQCIICIAICQRPTGSRSALVVEVTPRAVATKTWLSSRAIFLENRAGAPYIDLVSTVLVDVIGQSR